MLLQQTGRDSPLIVVFAGLAAGICWGAGETAGAVFAFIMLGMLFSLPRLPHLCIGLLLGLLVLTWAPRTVWLEGERPIQGRIASAGFEYGVYRIELSDLWVNNAPVRGRARLNVYMHVPGHAALGVGLDDELIGRRLRGMVRLTPPWPLGNRGETDHARRLLAQGITVTGSIRDYRTIELGERSGIPALAARVRALGTRPAVAFLDGLARPEAEILKAMLIGDRAGLTYQDQDGLAGLGISHIIAISGLNIGLMVLFGYTLAFSVIRLIPPLAARCDTPLVSKGVGLICALLYALIITPAFPSTRAVIMAVLLIVALVFLRRIALLDALALAALVIVVIWPYSLFATGFLLSFAAVLGIVLVMERLRETPRGVQFVAVTVAAAGFTLPIAGYVFGFVDPWCIVHNLIFVPIFSFLVMPLGMLGLLAAAVHAPCDWLFALAMEVIAFMRWSGVHWGMLVPVPRPALVWVYLGYLGLVIAFLARRVGDDDTPAKTAPMVGVILGGVCLALVILPAVEQWRRLSGPLTFDFISVGQGDSCLITRGAQAVLIDAGGSFSGFDTGRHVVGPHLLRRGITRLDLVVITHAHPDHVGGMPYILRRFSTGAVWINAPDDPGFQDVMRVTKLKSIPLACVARGWHADFNGMKINVLHPQSRLTYHRGLDANLHSLVLKIGDGTMQGLFMADAYFFGELTLVHGGDDLRAEVLKVAHHGSKGACLDLLLASVQPRVAVISCGRANRYGMPAAEVLARLMARRIGVFRTDDDGEVQISSHVGQLGIKSMRYRADKG